MLIALLLEYIRPYRWSLLAVVVMQTVQAGASLLLPTINAAVIDQGVAVGDIGRILSLGGWMLLVSLVHVCSAVGVVMVSARMAFSLGRALRSAAFRKVGTVSRQEVSQLGVPSLITRTTNDVQQVQMLVLICCTFLVTAPILVIGGVVLAMIQDVALSWLIVASAPVLLGALLLVMWKIVPLFRMMQRRLDRVNHVLREQLTGIRVVRAFVRERDEIERFEEANTAITDVALSVGRWNALTGPIIMGVVNFSSVAVLWFGAFRVESGSLEVGTLMAFVQYLMQILMAVMIVIVLVMMIPRAAVSAGRIRELLDTEASIAAPDRPVALRGRGGRIEFDAVGFRFEGAERPALRGLSFTVEPGTTTAVLGSTAAGKTTLVSLILRLIDASEGAVRFDGVDVRDVEPGALRDRIGFVPQKPFLFSGTIASNLRFGAPDASDEELWAALRTAQAEEFVTALPGALTAPVTQGGTSVSGGQRQRLAIARALLRRPDVLVFDDSFSALDAATDARLRDALRHDFPTTTQIVVAQRIASVRDADQIIVLERGEVVGRGTHDDLLAECRTYVEIAASQAHAEEAS